MSNPIYSVPNCYSGERNKKRIKAYRLLAEQFSIDESTVGHIFNAGIDFGINQTKEYASELITNLSKIKTT